MGGAGASQKTLGTYAGNVQHRAVIDDLFERGRHRLNGQQLAGVGGVFHALEFVVERQLGVAILVLKAASELEGGADGLENPGQLLNVFVLRPVVAGFEVAGFVGVDELLGAGVGDAALGVIERTLEVLQLLRQREDALASRLRHGELHVVPLEGHGATGRRGSGVGRVLVHVGGVGGIAGGLN